MININGATVMALSAFLESDDTNIPIEAAESDVKNMVISISIYGCKNTPFGGKPINNAKVVTTSTDCIMQSNPNTIIFDRIYASNRNPVMYSRRNIFRSLQTSCIEFNIPIQNPEHDNANNRLFVISYCSN